MRAIALALVLTSLASAAAADSPARRIIGCWAARTPALTSLMRWRALDERGDAMEGDRIVYDIAGETTRDRYTLAPLGAAWQMCVTKEEAPSACWLVAEETEGSLEGGRAFIDRFHDRLRVGIVDADGAETVIFDGQREEECD